ncbi:MAG: hypothetical protein C0592_12785 [Marinilabiliales bacterium]|nr:MAG: hypothetical protein C0592_12785 [Marinilabiliales bacterium]
MSKKQNFELFFPEEDILIQAQGFWVKGALNAKTGTAIMTNKRIAFIEQKQVYGGGLVGALVVEASGIKKPKLKLDVEIANIDRWEHPKKRDIRFFDKEGNKYTLRPVNFEEWDAKLKELRGE